MTIDGANISTFNAILLSKDIQPAKVEIYNDWLRNALNPIYEGKQETYKVIKISVLVKDENLNACITDISGLVKALEKCTIKFDDIFYYYDCVMSADAQSTLIDFNNYQLDVTLQSGYAYLPPVSTTLTGTSQTIAAQGNRPSPAVVTLTPSQDIGILNLSGLTKKPITVKNLHANVPVTIDGEKGLVTEANLDSMITSETGADHWIFRKYSMANIADPDNTDINIIPTLDMIPVGQTYIQQLIADAENLYQNGGYDYLGYLKTSVYVSSAKSIIFNFYHDDGASIYVNSVHAYGHSYHHVPQDSTGAATATLNLAAGWNKIEIIWIQHYGTDGIWGVTPVMGSQVEQLNCYHSLDGSSTGLINKFPDCDMWEFPTIQPGDNTVSIDSSVCNVEVSYKPKFM